MKARILITIAVVLLVLVAVSPAMPAAADKAAEQAQGAGQKKDAKSPPVLEQVTFVNIPYWSSPPWYPPADETDSYRVAMGGLRWLAEDPLVDCVVYTSNAPPGAFAAVLPGFQEWDNATAAAIYGTVSENNTDPAPGIVADAANTISWGPIDGPGGIIAVTNFWYWPNTKEVVEFDMVLDDAEPWSVTGAPDAFDVQNVTTHELGHTLVLDDLRSPRDGALTMHAYTWPGDVGKRTLGAGDVFGIQAIYGQ